MINELIRRINYYGFSEFKKFRFDGNTESVLNFIKMMAQTSELVVDNSTFISNN